MYTHTLDEAFHEQTFAKRDALIPVTVFIAMEITVGFVGNLTILSVFLLKYHTCSYRYFVISLATYDLIGTMTTMPAEIIQHRYWHEYPSDALCKAKSFCVILTVGGNCLTLLTISVDRYRRVCRPLGWQIKTKNARVICVVVLICAVLLSAPIPIYRGSNTKKVQLNNDTIHFTVCDGDDDFDGSDVRFYITIPLIIILGLCLLIMFVLYSFIVVKLLVGKNKILQSGGQNMAPPKIEASSKSARSGNSSNTSTHSSESNEAHTHSAKSSKEHAHSEKSSKTHTLSESMEPNDTNDRCDDSIHCKSPKTGNRPLGGSRSPNKYATFARFDRLRKRTLLMFILTTVFFTTSVLYLILISFAMVSDDTMYGMTTTMLPVYMFFLRLVFINHVINPFVYGYLDQEFRHLFLDCAKACKRFLFK